jgi:dipeptidyl-peptidase III
MTALCQSLFPRQAPVNQLGVKLLFDGLSEREKLFAHHLSRAAWHGSRIILRQTSPEGPGIFDFIMALYKSCEGRWNQLAYQSGVILKELESFLEYCGHFLSNMGNYIYVSTTFYRFLTV